MSGELVLEIPFKNIFSSSTKITVKGFYLLASPNDDVAFDPDKEKFILKEAKAKLLASIEEAKLQKLAGCWINNLLYLFLYFLSFSHSQPHRRSIKSAKS